jgi:DNA helicase-2/ATP-dependent DNA helicase PcrA
MIYKLYGPPGTGKTYRLINRAKAYMRTGTDINSIGYFAFTRKAALEAQERMPVENKKLIYFQTIHSFCFNILKLNEDQVMQPHHYQDLGKQLSIRVKYIDKFNKEETHFLTCDNPYFQMITRCINRDISIRDEFDRNEHNKKEIKWKRLEHIYENYLEYKKLYKLYDFNDMIKMMIEKQSIIPKFKVIFIDEAQDLSPLQWKLYDILKNKADDIYLAGDDDQAIFAWAGADVKRFIQEPAKEKILKYSKRVSRSIQKESQIPIGKITGIRKEKQYFSREIEGRSEYISNLGQVNLDKGKWLVLTRTKNGVLKITKELKRRNFYYETKSGKSFAVRAYKAIALYEKLKLGTRLQEQEINDLRDYIEDFNDTNKSWYDAFTLLALTEKNYIKNLIDSGENLESKARIWVSTIHSIKGGEQDNVILSLEQGDKIKKSIKKSIEKQDEEHRVWYVAITRAKYNLYKLKSKIKRKGYQL